MINFVICLQMNTDYTVGFWSLLPLPAWAEGTVLSLCVCLSVCYHKIDVKSKSKQATSHKLGNLRQKWLSTRQASSCRLKSENKNTALT